MATVSFTSKQYIYIYVSTYLLCIYIHTHQLVSVVTQARMLHSCDRQAFDSVAWDIRGQANISWVAKDERGHRTVFRESVSLTVQQGQEEIPEPDGRRAASI